MSWKFTSAAGAVKETDVSVTFSSSPPASPTDGQFWIFPADATNGVNWQFRYNAGSASAYKWEFIGGSSLRTAEGSATAVTSTTYVDLGPSLTIARAGDYEFAFGGHIYNATTTNHVFISISTSVSGAADGDSAATENGAVVNAISVGKIVTLAGLTAGSTAKLQVRVAGGSGYYSQCYFLARPVRVI